MKRNKVILIVVAAILCGVFGVGYYHMGTVNTKSILLTKSSSANYWPSSSGIAVSDVEYFGYDISVDEAAGDSPNVTVSFDVCLDGTNWKTYTEPVFYSITAAPSATLTITDELHYVGSIHPMACPKWRIKLTENAADDDDTVTIVTFHQ